MSTAQHTRHRQDDVLSLGSIRAERKPQRVCPVSGSLWGNDMPFRVMSSAISHQPNTVNSAQHHHPGHPEEDEVTSCFQNGIGVELFQVFCLLRPAEQCEREETRREPSIKHIWVCCWTASSSTFLYKSEELSVHLLLPLLELLLCSFPDSTQTTVSSARVQ